MPTLYSGSTDEGHSPKLSSLRVAAMPPMAAALRVGADWLVRAALGRRGHERQELLAAAETLRLLAQAVEDVRVLESDLNLLARCARGEGAPLPPPPPPPPPVDAACPLDAA